MSDAAELVLRLDRAVRLAVAAGEIGAAKSMRLHVGAPAGELPEIGALLALGDAIFGCGRRRLEVLEGDGTRAVLGVWEAGQIGTISSATCEAPMVILTVLGQDGALHFQQQGA